MALLLGGFVTTRAVAAGNVVVNGSPSFTAAGGVARTYMDVGGVWNGTASDANGDRFSITLRNSGSTGAFNLAPTVTLPANFTRIGSVQVSVSSGATPSVSASGSTGTFSLVTGSGNYELPAGATITYTFGLRAENGVVGGTYQVGYGWTWADTNGGPAVPAVTTQQNIIAREGAYVVENSPAKLALKVNESGVYTYTITNTGLGGLFNLQFTELTGSSWTFQSFGALTVTPGTLASGTAAAGGSTVSIPYLAPGAKLAIPVTGQVTDCFDIKNNFRVQHAVAAAQDYYTPVELNLQSPLVDFTLPNITLSYATPVAVNIPIQNTGNGAAASLKLATNLNTFALTVSNVAAGWSYNAGTGLFTYNTGSGLLANAASTTLTFNVVANDPCTAAPSGSYLATATYTDMCGNSYALPTEIGAISPWTNAPTLGLTKTASAQSLGSGATGHYTLTVTASNVGGFNAVAVPNLVVSDVLPASITFTSLSIPPTGNANYDAGSRTVTWTIPVGSLAATQSLQINFTLPVDPCLGGTSETNTASTNTLQTTAGCTISRTDSAGVYISNFGTTGTITSQMQLNTGAFPTTQRGGQFETGAASADATRDLGEGEFIPVLATYAIEAGYVGTWSGSTYRDDFGNLSGARLVPGTAQVSIDGGGSWTAVPPASITSLPSAHELALNLGFLAGASYFNDPNVGAAAARDLRFRYRLTATDADLGGELSRQVTQQSILTISGGTAGACTGGVFTQWLLYNIARAEANIAVSMPTSIELCASFSVTITVSNGSSQRARNLLTTLITDGTSKYTYVTGQTPTYGGDFNGGNITITENAGVNPTFQFTGAELTQTSTITVLVRRKQAPAPAPLDTAPSALSTKVDFDDSETAPSAGTREFTDNASATPLLVRAADLSLVATPQNVLVIDTAVSWTAYVANGGNGTAYDSKLVVTFPSGIVPDTAANLATAINNANGTSLVAGDITISGQQVTINLGSLNSGVQRRIPLTGFLDQSTCNFTSSIAAVAQWGCGGDTYQTETQVNPTFTQPPASLQIIHDTTNSKASLCDNSTIEIIIRNVGQPTVYDVVVTENLGSVAATGLSFIPGSVTVSLNGGGYSAAGDPTGPGTNLANGVLVWDKDDIASLGELIGQTNPNPGGRPHTIRIRFTVSANATANSSSPSIIASLTAKLPCGTSASSPGSAYALPLLRPDITVSKTGINRTAAGGAFASGTFGKTVYGGQGDVVEWRVQITNNGNFAAKNVRVRDVLGGSGGAVDLKNSAGTTVKAGYVDNTWESLPDIPASTTVNYYFVETLGGTCVASGVNTASVVWGCVPADSLTTPSDNNDTATLIMAPNYAGSGGSVTQTITTSGAGLTNGRLRQRITFTNGGGTAKDLTVALTLPGAYDVDSSYAPILQSNTTSYTGVTLSGAHPNYTLTLTNAVTGIMRNGQAVTLELYLVPSGADSTANTAAPTMAQVAAYQMPETTGNGLDTSPPANFTIPVTVSFNSTCGTPSSENHTSGNVNARTADLDLTVTPSPLQFSSPLAPYTYVFDYEIRNNGEANSSAANIQFRLPTVGSDWTSISATLITFGTGGSTVTTTNSGNNYLIDSANIGTLAQNATAIVRVTAITKPAAATPIVDNLVLVGEVEGSVMRHDGSDSGINYSLDRAAPLLTSGLTVSGFLYLDADHDALRDATEAGLGASAGTFYAKLIDRSAPGVAVAAVAVNMTTGYYEITGMNQGDYTIIIDDNNTLADVTPTTIANHIGTEMPGLTREVSVGVASVVNQNFGQFRGAKITGNVFRDTGRNQDNTTGGGTANDGIRQPPEAGIASVTVKATDGGSTTYDTAVTDGDGNYTLWVSIAGASTAVHVVETNPADFHSTGAGIGTSGGAYTLATDTIAFTAAAGTTYTGLNFGDVPPNAFLTDGQQVVLPGSSVTYPHTFVAGTAGKVKFSVASATASPTLPVDWSQLIYHDANGDGAVNPGETLLQPTDEITVIAGQQVMIVLKQFAPVGAPMDARNKVVLAAEFSATGNAGMTYAALNRQDITITGLGGVSGLDLVKSVDVAKALPGESITYTIAYTNNGKEPISTLKIADATPAYTTFVSAAAGALPDGLTGVVITTPSPTGAIIWTFTGSLPPGGTGTVTFVVKVDN
ncbi:MAG: DUF11 domain-containing protein [Opitutaceae bacterium]|nr:DUF11 domain-containing protein [Opitutaceae bacterium]